MCDICIMNKIKKEMISRRSFFKASAITGAIVTMGSIGFTPNALAKGHSSVMDMTHTLHENFPTYFGEPQFSKKQIYNYAEHHFNLFEYQVNEHTGTHIDAPLHFSEDGSSVDEISVENLVAPLCVINISEKASNNPDSQVTPEDISTWISSNGSIPDNACVAMQSGWSSKVNSDSFRNFDGEAQHYPGFHVETVKMLAEETKASSIAVDTLSLDHGISADFATHYAWLPTGRFGIECLANLDKVPEAGTTLVIGAPKHKGGTGGPARIIALV